MNKKIELSESDKEYLKLYVNNLDELIEKDDYYELRYAIDDALIGELDDEYNSTPTSRKLQEIEDRLIDNHSKNFPKD